MAGTMNTEIKKTDDNIAALTLVGLSASGYEHILTDEALSFVAKLEQSFGQRRRDLLKRRLTVQAKFDAGGVPSFRDDTKHIRDENWKILGTPDDLQDRRVEITGPVERKMMINAFACGANVFMTDFEDASSPTWANTMNGQVNLYDFARGSMEHTDPKSGKEYKLADNPAVLKVRPRGWHLEEAHVHYEGKRISAGIFDFALHFFHNAKQLLANGSGPYFYLPKMECYEEAQLWDDVFTMAEKLLDVPHGSIKTTVLIETLPAAFEMDEILYALKDHIVGLNCGRWDYIFSFIKCLGRNPNYLLPDRSQVVMGEGFLKAYSLLLIKTCHRRGAHAMGGMAAQIPIKNDVEANEKALAKVKADKEREVTNGHDGTWVAHPALVAVAKDVFDKAMPLPNQIDRLRDDIEITEQDLLEVHKGERTEGGLRENLRVGVQYLAAWLAGRGAVPLYNLMEDAATAEISRSQVWQWRTLGAALSDGRVVDENFISACFDDEMDKLLAITSDEDTAKKLNTAADLFRKMIFSDNPPEFLTLPAYELII